MEKFIKRMINVTKTFLPPQEEYQEILKRAWDNSWITNRGSLVQELEENLLSYLALNQVVLTTNGTIPLQIALKVLAKGGEVITSPFSYVATTATIVWENCKPVFVDIHPEYLTIDEIKIEEAITDKTTAILVTHVFGNPCNVEEIQRIAGKYKLKVIYDAAHCFGVTYKNESIFNYGDVSTCSFHATKLFHTGEGGAMFTSDKELQHKLFYSHNFGHNGPLAFHGVGINAKMSELQAAMGLSVLPYMGTILAERKKVVDFYNANLDFSKLKALKIRKNTHWNYSYYPVIFESEAQLLRVEKALSYNQIMPRRYFYPSLNTIDYTKGQSMPISENIASRIMCLPLYVGLSENDLERIVSLINTNLC
ncbi:dTDP-4-amino-4,6-dideoxygalactose transaminase [Flavobacterium granuli]|uniref:dTDP-4-amino-4,6-dideoxygalactose transaminase n=2 Tax=Flavobacterium granuli TaxID=280093 RepID=A0A1M5QKH6_9FLAO|nr:dTDP-4-amino-4,6-dideoxygalactose transaminase [Flavobacterium granuli]SHH14270.1 dTDP-4-amino-4,6-dideoxygalactose transaminase [Flavobacterium granuli]